MLSVFLSLYVQTKWYGTVLSGVLDITFFLQAHYQTESRKVSCTGKSAL